MRIFRLHRKQRSATDYSGSLRFSSRWNPAGTAMLYCASSLALACLEQLVHLDPEEVPGDYAYTSATIGSPLEQADFRGNLRDADSTRRFGHRWATDQRSHAILVPSVIIPVECNVLLNPLHPQFPEITWDASQPFEFDPRLLKSR